LEAWAGSGPAASPGRRFQSDRRTTSHPEALGAPADRKSRGPELFCAKSNRLLIQLRKRLFDPGQYGAGMASAGRLANSYPTGRTRGPHRCAGETRAPNAICPCQLRLQVNDREVKARVVKPDPQHIQLVFAPGKCAENCSREAAVLTSSRAAGGVAYGSGVGENLAHPGIRTTSRRAAGACGRSGTAARCGTSPRYQLSL
jgi:hypothetical protein